MPPEWQAAWTAINVFGWPTVILGAYFWGKWISKAHADEAVRALKEAYNKALEQHIAALTERDKKYDDMKATMEAHCEEIRQFHQAQMALKDRQIEEWKSLALEGTLLARQAVGLADRK